MLWNLLIFYDFPKLMLPKSKKCFLNLLWELEITYHYITKILTYIFFYYFYNLIS